LDKNFEKILTPCIKDKVNDTSSYQPTTQNKYLVELGEQIKKSFIEQGKTCPFNFKSAGFIPEIHNHVLTRPEEGEMADNHFLLLTYGIFLFPVYN
jgi:hypothetical protein